ncbi:MAG: large conductance mechanosensitive channel protein MscL [Thermotogae bacterium]|nr:large conductance mechanosensitive channel protein MscL [Thermotogota bacterium]
MLKEFLAFIKRGNVLDMAVGIVIGIAFGGVVKSFVDNILMPPIGLLLGGVDFSNLFIVLKAGDPAGPYKTLEAAREAGAVVWPFGIFINSVVNFLIVAFAVFLIVKLVALTKPKPKEESKPSTPPEDILLLREIRDLLKNR